MTIIYPSKNLNSVRIIIIIIINFQTSDTLSTTATSSIKTIFPHNLIPN